MKIFKNFLAMLFWVFIVVLIVSGLVSYEVWQFRIYQKKFGDKMTFVEFLFDQSNNK